MLRVECVTTIKSVEGIPEKKREEFVSLVKPLLTNSMDSYACSELIKAVAGIPDDERKDVIEHSQKFSTNIISLPQIIKSVARIPDDEREDVVISVELLLENCMDRFNCEKLINVVAGIPVNEIKDVLTQSQRLVKPFMFMCIADAQEIIKSLAGIPKEKRERFAAFIGLAVEYMNVPELLKLIKFIASKTEDEWKGFMILHTPRHLREAITDFPLKGSAI